MSKKTSDKPQFQCNTVGEVTGLTKPSYRITGINSPGNIRISDPAQWTMDMNNIQVDPFGTLKACGDLEVEGELVTMRDLNSRLRRVEKHLCRRTKTSILLDKLLNKITLGIFE